MELTNSQSPAGVALIILALGEDIGPKVLRKFNQDELKSLTRQMSTQNDIKEEDAIKAISTFFKDYTRHSGILGGSRQYIVNVLKKTLNGNLAKDLVAEIYGDDLRKYAESLSWIPAKILAQTIKEEHVSMQALLVAHLPVDTAQQLLQEFSDSECQELLLQVSKDQVLSAAVTTEIKELIDKCKSDYDAGGLQNLDGTKIAAGIINRYSGDKSKLFEYFKNNDPERANALELALFDFTVVFSQEQSVLEELNKHVSIELWAMALKGTSTEQREVIINSYTSRLSTQLKDEMEMLGSVTKSQVNKARNDILDIIRTLQASDQLSLNLGADELVS